MTKKIGNMDPQDVEKAAEYFRLYWKHFTNLNPQYIGEEGLQETLSYAFLSGFSAGINIGMDKKKSLIEEIIKSN